jgi:chorismate dehydratase
MIRIGMVNYINTAPIYEIWKERSMPSEWVIIEGQPSHLNTMLANDQIDMGFVSSYAYAIEPERYQILADLSISATGPVGSVFLFSQLPPEALDDKLIILTGQSDTSIRLVKIILEEFHRVQPRYAIGEVYGPTAQTEGVSGVLAIGDDALRLRAEQRYPWHLDLGEMWYRRTGLPFVFSVCVVREAFLLNQPAAAKAIQCCPGGVSRGGFAANGRNLRPCRPPYSYGLRDLLTISHGYRARSFAGQIAGA